MRRKVFATLGFALLLQLFTAAGFAQSGLHNNGAVIHVSPGCYMHVDGDLSSTGPISLEGKIGLTGDLTADDPSGTFRENGKLVLRGSTAQHIAGSETIQLHKLEVRNNMGVVLNNDLFVTSEIKLKNGSIDLNGHEVELDAYARLKDEDYENRIFGYGVVKITEDIGSPSDANPGALGATISSPENLGMTTIERRQYGCLLSGSDSSFGYIYSIEPAYNTALNAQLTLAYPEPEGVEEIDEDNLVLYRSLDNGLTWHQMGGFADGDDNEITLTGIDHFSTWTAGFPGTVLPLDLIAFGAIPLSNSIQVYFVTENETAELDHFEVERSADGINFIKLGEAPPRAIGLGIQKVYAKKDYSVPTGSWYYRVKIVNIDGGYTYSDIAFAKRLPGEAASLGSRNVLAAGESLYFAGFDGEARLRLFDLSGRIVMDNPTVTTAGVSLKNTLASGIYFYQLTQGKTSLLSGQIIVK